MPFVLRLTRDSHRDSLYRGIPGANQCLLFCGAVYSRSAPTVAAQSRRSGSNSALAFVLVLITPERFACGKQVGSYLGLIPCEDSSAGKQRLGHLTKQGHTLLRYLLVEAAQTAARCDPLWHRRFVHLSMRRDRGIAKAALARKLAVSLYWLWRNSRQQATAADLGSHVG